MIASPWNSLEIVKLLLSLVTPILVVVCGFWLNRAMKKFEQSQWRNQKLVEKRLSIFDRLAPLLNDNLCYFTYVGSWKERSPEEVVASKRLIDKEVHLAGPLMSRQFFDAAMRFQELCFQTYNDWGQDAKLRTKYQRRLEAAGPKWDGSWNDMFSADSGVVQPEQIRCSYAEVMACFSKELGIASGSSALPSGHIPSNIR